MASSPPASPSLKRRKTDYSDLISRGFQTEHNVGVTEFIGKQRPFIGALKHRFEDFIVHEVNPAGEIVRLTANTAPEDLLAAKEEKEATVEVADLVGVGGDILEAIRTYAEGDSAEALLLETDHLDKDGRTKLHAFIRQQYPKLGSTTQTTDTKRLIRVFRQSGNQNEPRRRGNERRHGDNRSQKRLSWPKDQPSYVHFVLYKENMETVQAVNELARRLACTPKNFTFSGSKDKRAITTQMFAAWKIPPSAIWKAVQEFNRRARYQIKMAVGHFSYEKEPLKLGDLSGNHFEIVLRNLRLVDELEQEDNEAQSEEELKSTVESSLESLKSTGFINYFGMQRFGSHRIDSHKMGILILKKQFKTLVEEILVEKPVDRRPYQNRNEVSFNEAIRIWRETGDAATAYKKLNYKYTLEGSLLRGLTRVQPNDYHGALCIGLVRNSRLLYLHAYQSYLWNRVASWRIREMGLEVVEGDLVFVGADFIDETVLLEGEETEEEVAPAEEAELDSETQSTRIKANIPPEQILLVTAENRHQFTIYDVVLPIIGGLSKFPTNSTKQYIDSLLAQDGVSLEDFRALNKQWCVNGSYRKLVVKPKNCDWKWKCYIDDTRPLVETDLDCIAGKTISDEVVTESNRTRKQNALIIAVTLPTSCYATVMLRELTKVSSLALENKPWQTGGLSTDVREKLQQPSATPTGEEVKSTAAAENVAVSPVPIEA